MYKLYIETVSGAYNCFRCGNSGSWYDFKSKIMSIMHGVKISECVEPHVHSSNSPLSNFDLKKSTDYFKAMENDIYPEINDFLTGRETQEQRWIKKETLEIFKVGVGLEKFRDDTERWVSYPAVYFPMF